MKPGAGVGLQQQHENVSTRSSTARRMRTTKGRQAGSPCQAVASFEELVCEVEDGVVLGGQRCGQEVARHQPLATRHNRSMRLAQRVQGTCRTYRFVVELR